MKNKTSQLIVIMLFIMIQSACSQNVHEKAGGINWMSFEEAVSKSDKVPRKLLIDVYTNWCGWCKRMDQTTYQDPALINAINKDYYAVRLNAETRDTIRFRGKAFVFRPEYKANEIALSLLAGKMGYPTTVFLDQSMNILSVKQGYLDVAALGEVLKSLEPEKKQ